jgi:CRP-like cAMP-binding protein
LKLDDHGLALFRAMFACPAEVAERIAAPARDARYPAKSLLVRPDAPSEEIGMIVAGTARMLFYTPDGNVIHLHDLETGDWFGTLDPAELSATEVVALTQLRAAMYRLGDFVLLAEQYGVVGLALSRMLLRRLQRTTGRMLERSTLSAVGRVHAELQRLGQASGDTWTIAPAPPLTSIAAKALTTRETTSRAIAALERRGIIRRAEGEIRIVSPRQLAELIF